MSRLFLVLASIVGGIAVLGGAFGAHAFKEILNERSLEIFNTGIRYQMYHALALLGVGILLMVVSEPQPLIVTAGWAFVVGIVVFSGSLYALSFTGIKILGAITPLGGAAFLIGWGCLAVASWNLPNP